MGFRANEVRKFKSAQSTNHHQNLLAIPCTAHCSCFHGTSPSLPDQDDHVTLA